MEIAAYMLSCPARETVRTATLASFASTDWSADPTVEIDRSTHQRAQDRQTETALGLLERALHDGASMFLFLEDDLQFNRFLRHNLERWPPLAAAQHGSHFFASLYNPGVRIVRMDRSDQYFVADPCSVYGSQALVLSAATARHVVDQWYSEIGMQDIKMSRLAGDVTQIYYHRPSLVQHARVHSVWGGPYHRAIDFSQTWKSNR
jgi:hypothetical protein